MSDKLTEDRAQIIYNAVMNDPSFFLQDGWLLEHHVTRDECETFLQYAVDLARMYEWREANRTVGAVEVPLEFTKHSGKVGSDDEQWTVFAPQVDTTKILRVAESGKVIATLEPEQMPLPLDGDLAVVDMSTGELL